MKIAKKFICSEKKNICKEINFIRIFSSLHIHSYAVFLHIACISIMVNAETSILSGANLFHC